MEINLISDTVTKPCSNMLDLMINCKVGDDVFKEDPTVNKLENMIAEMFGMESSLFFSLWNNGKSNSYKNSYRTWRSNNL